jgi:hypothetical protein
MEFAADSRCAEIFYTFDGAPAGQPFTVIDGPEREQYIALPGKRRPVLGFDSCVRCVVVDGTKRTQDSSPLPSPITRRIAPSAPQEPKPDVSARRVLNCDTLQNDTSIEEEQRKALMQYCPPAVATPSKPQKVRRLTHKEQMEAEQRDYEAKVKEWNERKAREDAMVEEEHRQFRADQERQRKNKEAIERRLQPDEHRNMMNQILSEFGAAVGAAAPSALAVIEHADSAFLVSRFLVARNPRPTMRETVSAI